MKQLKINVTTSEWLLLLSITCSLAAALLLHHHLPLLWTWLLFTAYLLVLAAWWAEHRQRRAATLAARVTLVPTPVYIRVEQSMTVTRRLADRATNGVRETQLRELLGMKAAGHAVITRTVTADGSVKITAAVDLLPPQ